jgi:peptidoglycan glycosyltransferase
MNAPIARLFVVVLVLFGVLVFATSWNAVFSAPDLRANAKNQREVLAQQKIRRGTIRAADGTVLARSIKRSDATYTRRYPQGDLAPHAVGYSYVRFGRAGLEKQYNSQLAGEKGEFGSLLDEVLSTTPVGQDLRTTIDPGAQRAAIAGLAGRKGAVVALDPRTGAIKAMVSTPGYDPASLPDGNLFSKLNTEPSAPLLNRTTQAGYPPGSTFKVVTAIAAIDSGRYTPNSLVSGRNGKVISGVPLNNFAGEQFGDITLTTALTHSVNTVWAEVGEKLGGSVMKKYMDRLGFDEQVPVDLPSGERAPSGEFVKNRFVPPTNRNVDVGRMAIGQDKLRVTPLQMAMVASAVANDGVLMKPHLGDQVIDADGRVVKRVGGEEMSRVMSPQTAQQVNAMMQQVVREGTGTAAALSGIDVAGKTGTAEKNVAQHINQPWFIGFAPATNPKVVVAATVETSIGGTGGEVAGPIAKSVMEEVLR